MIPDSAPIEIQEDILILAPTGKDAQLVASAIGNEPAPPRIAPTIGELCSRLRSNQASILVIAEEALTQPGIEALNQALESQEAWSDVPIILMTNGGETTLSILRIRKAFSPSGNLTLLERPFRRITLQSVVDVALRARRKQHEVRSLIGKHQAATRLRDEFISIASHELKTPLTSLKLQTQLNQRLLSRGDPDALSLVRMNRSVESTAQQVERLSRLVEDMLDISRINTGRLLLDRKVFNLAELVRETVDRMLPQLEAAQCAVSVETSAEVIGSWDRYRLEQVLTNLLTNAIRYSPGNPVHVILRETSGAAILQVRDEGPGIAPENQERIFNRFERAVNNQSISGLGLGLYICREIVEAHLGTIQVENLPQPGACFTISLPILAPRQASE